MCQFTYFTHSSITITKQIHAAKLFAVFMIISNSEEKDLWCTKSFPSTQLWLLFSFSTVKYIWQRWEKGVICLCPLRARSYRPEIISKLYFTAHVSGSQPTQYFPWLIRCWNHMGQDVFILKKGFCWQHRIITLLYYNDSSFYSILGIEVFFLAYENLFSGKNVANIKHYVITLEVKAQTGGKQINLSGLYFCSLTFTSPIKIWCSLFKDYLFSD